MNWLDVLLLLPLLLGLVRGLTRGAVFEVISLVIVVLGVCGARLWASMTSAWLLQQFAWPKAVCDVVSYVVIFLAIATALSIVAKLLTKLLHAIYLGWLNRIFGGVIGLLKYGIVVLFVVYVMNWTNQSYHWIDNSQVVKTSVVYPQMVKICNTISRLVPISAKENKPSEKQ